MTKQPNKLLSLVREEHVLIGSWRGRGGKTRVKREREGEGRKGGRRVERKREVRRRRKRDGRI